MIITKYSDEDKSLWNEFVKNCKNTHFFFQRDYMEYHKDKFLDFSLIIKNETGKLVALFPANLDKNVLYSHQGLTFGGLLVNDRIKTITILEIFNLLKEYLKNHNIDKLIYKSIPYIYHSKPAEEDRYALFMNNAQLIRRDVTSTINLNEPVRYSKGRKWSINKAKKEDLDVSESMDYKSFWKLLIEVLESNHKAKPVHTLSQIKKLANLFPKNIKLYLAHKNKNLLAGAVIYENYNIVHTQYLATSTEGKDAGALDFLIGKLISEVYQDRKYFDFGISNENEGKILNAGLIAQKEGFGASSVSQDQYEIEIRH